MSLALEIKRTPSWFSSGKKDISTTPDNDGEQRQGQYAWNNKRVNTAGGVLWDVLVIAKQEPPLEFTLSAQSPLPGNRSDAHTHAAWAMTVRPPYCFSPNKKSSWPVADIPAQEQYNRGNIAGLSS